LRIELDSNDIQSIAREVAALVSPLLSGMDKQGEDEILDVSSLAAYLKVSTKWIYERTHLKEIPHIKAGGQLRFRKKIIDKWLDSFKIPAVNQATGLKAIGKKQLDTN